VVLADEGDVAPDGQIGYQGDLQGNEGEMRPVNGQEFLQSLFERPFIFEEPQMNLKIDDNTSMVTMARKTLTIPFNTEIGMLVSSFDAFKPSRIGISVMKNPKVAHLIIRMKISRRSVE
jgi:hypothetical protein